MLEIGSFERAEVRMQAWEEQLGHHPERLGTRPPGDDGVILVVDDDASVRALFSVVLRGLGPTVIEASGGEEALRLADEHALAAVVLDSNMPDKCGFDVLCALRAQPATARVPVIFVTGVSDVPERVRALNAGAHDYLVKPVDLDELRARVGSQLLRHRDQEGEENRLRGLASAVTTLSQARVDGSVELIAAAACREMGHLHDSVDLSVHAFLGDGRTECLAEHRRDGDTTPGGRPLDAEQGRRAYQRAAGGPWVETTHAGIVHVRGDAPVLAGPRTAAWVPLSTPDHVLGVMMIRADGFVVDDLINRVTEAMLTATEFAPTITALLSPGLEQRNATHERRARLQHVMDGAFHPVFQPIVDLSDRTVQGYEALTRFADGTRPELRLAEAASLGGLVALEAALFRAALGAVPALPRAGWVSVNVSPSMLLDTATLRDVLSDHDHPPLVLEITEHDRIDDYEAIQKAVDELGIETRLSVDDIGNGYSCLRHILDLRPAFIKLDTSWVRGIERDPARQALVAGLTHFSKQTGCELIAEGIETESQLQTLLELGVCLGQGFHLGRPSPVESVAGLVPSAPAPDAQSARPLIAEGNGSGSH